MEGHADSGTCHHEKVCNGEMLGLDSEKVPDLEAHGIARVLHVTQHSGAAHDGETDPEEVKEAMEVAIVALGIEVGDTGGELDGREDAATRAILETALLCASLLTCIGEGLDGGRSVVGNGRGSTAGGKTRSVNDAVVALRAEW